ncbi:hypothetical protein SH668x_003008 [Planctomicrobium sp. SH668]|uniref:hypothetical protein n=1 Tax=Planctomicrobium sp. SH668 TaxID=3448126 RepID=UPI003F5B78D5
MFRPVACTYVMLTACYLTVASGCYHMYSQPYGYSGAPSATPYPGTIQYQQAPISTLQPGQPYTPGVYPQGGTTTYPQGGLTPIPDNGSNAPTYNPNPTPGTTNPQTPNPYYPPGSTYNIPQNKGLYSSQPTSIQQAAYNQPTPSKQLMETSRALRSSDIDLTSESELESQETEFATPLVGSAPVLSTTPAPISSFAPEESTTFELPVVQEGPAKSSTSNTNPFETPAPAEPSWDVETNKVVSDQESTFGNDGHFQWLRGIVSKDPIEGTWSITYNDKPSEDDRWGGHFSLAENSQLYSLKDGDTVVIHGQVDNVVKDQFGKPVYQISTVKKTSL